MVKERSLFKLTDKGINPEYYSYSKTGKKPEQFTVDYDYKDQTLMHSGLQQEFPLQDNDQDLLSFQIAMMLGLQQAIAPQHYRIADQRRIEDYDLKIAGEKVFDTRLGKLHTVVLEYHDVERKRTFTFWCAKELNYLPYQSRKIESDGDVILLRLRYYNKQPAGLKSGEDF